MLCTRKNLKLKVLFILNFFMPNNNMLKRNKINNLTVEIKEISLRKK